MYKAIVFSRVSSTHQDLVQQTDEVLSEALRNGYNKEEIIFIEQKESAIKLDEEERIGLQQLKSNIERYDTISCVFVYEISRISRRPKVLYSIRDYLIEKGVQLVCIKPYMKLLEDGKLSQTASIMFSIFASLSESEMMIKKERMRRGANHAKQMGRHAGGYVMFGYTTDKEHKYHIDPIKGNLVKRIFNEYVYGDKSMRLLTRELQEEGHFKGIKFLTAVQEVYDILHRDCYCGKRNGMPAIISEELYEKSVQKRKDSELKVNHTDNMALCKGILRDANSGLLLSSNTAAKMYFSKRQSGVAVGMHIIEPIIWEESIKLYSKFKTVDKEQILNELIKKVQISERKIKTLTDKIFDIESKKDKIEERLIMGKISESKADELEGLLDNEASEYKKRIMEIQSEQYEANMTVLKLYENDKDIEIDYDNANKEQRYNIVHTVIEKAILKRISRYVLEISIYNKVDRNIKTIRVNSYTKKKEEL